MNDDTVVKEIKEEVKDESFAEKKASKAKIIATIALCIALIVSTIALIIYFISKSFIATTFIDGVVAKINTSIDSYSNYDSIVDSLRNYQNAVGDFSIKLSSKNKNLEYLNDFELQMKEYSATDYFALEMDFLYNKKSLINLDGYFDSNDIFFESKDIYDGLLKLHLNDKEMQESLDDLIKIFKLLYEMDEKDISKILINAYAEAIKISDITRKFNGTTVNYKIDINDNNVGKVNKKFKSTLNENHIIRELIEIIEKYYNEDEEENVIKKKEMLKPMALEENETSFLDDLFEPMIISVNVDIFSREIKDFKITLDNNEFIEGYRMESGKYRVGNDNNYLILDFDVDRFSMLEYDYKEKVSEIIFEKKSDRIIKRIKTKEVKYDIEESENNFTVTFNVDSKDYGKFDGTIKIVLNEGKNESTLNASINTEVEGYKVNLKINGTEKYGDNLFTKKDLDTYKNIEDLSESEYNSIFNKLLEKFMQFE